MVTCSSFSTKHRGGSGAQSGKLRNCQVGSKRPLHSDADKTRPPCIRLPLILGSDVTFLESTAKCGAIAVGSH